MAQFSPLRLVPLGQALTSDHTASASQVVGLWNYRHVLATLTSSGLSSSLHLKHTYNFILNLMPPLCIGLTKAKYDKFKAVVTVS